MNNTKVSVITCLYNTEPSLFKKCLESIHSQTFEDFEVLIINDGSTKYLDENKKIINSFNDNRFKYFDTEHTGKSQTLNFGFNTSKSKYIAICDSDDCMKPERLEYQYYFLENSDYEVISNAMILDDTHVIFPSLEESHEVHDYDIGYSCMHPSMMLDKDAVLNKVPFLFSQIYDSMEDAVFNFIMYHYGVKMWYDSNILQVYSHMNENSIHYENINDKLKRDYFFKLRYQTFNYKSDDNENTTAILLINNKWKTDIEKTILNIRMTANNVKIIVVDYSTNKNDLSYLKKYNVVIINDLDYKEYSHALFIGILNCTTKYCMIISKPFRFINQDWDIEFERICKFNYQNGVIIEPYMQCFYKYDENNYANENGKNNEFSKFGMSLHLLDKNILSKNDEIRLYSEYINTHNIPIIDEDLIFFTQTDHIKKFINGITLFKSSQFISAYLSISSILCGGKNIIYLYNKGVVLNDNIIDYNNDNILYYIDMFELVCMFCNETKYIYEKILWDSFIDKSIPQQIVNNHLSKLNDINQIKNSINFYFDMSYFLKNNNNDVNQWYLTHAPY